MDQPQWVSTTEYFQAWRVTENNLRAVASWCAGRAAEVERCIDFYNAYDELDTAEVGDWVIRGATDRFFALTDDGFREHYQPSGPPPETPIRGVLTGKLLRVTRRN